MLPAVSKEGMIHSQGDGYDGQVKPLFLRQGKQHSNRVHTPPLPPHPFLVLPALSVCRVCCCLSLSGELTRALVGTSLVRYLDRRSTDRPHHYYWRRWTFRTYIIPRIYYVYRKKKRLMMLDNRWIDGDWWREASNSV